MNRRGLLLGLFAAPAIIRTPGLLMPVKPLPVIREVYGRAPTLELLEDMRRLREKLLVDLLSPPVVLSRDGNGIDPSNRTFQLNYVEMKRKQIETLSSMLYGYG